MGEHFSWVSPLQSDGPNPFLMALGAMVEGLRRLGDNIGAKVQELGSYFQGLASKLEAVL